VAVIETVRRMLVNGVTVGAAVPEKASRDDVNE